jgi:8-oxo-dGTP pyrophosphatase MutT (NUDIX family)
VKYKDLLSMGLALKITAIRETFEETGTELRKKSLIHYFHE